MLHQLLPTILSLLPLLGINTHSAQEKYSYVVTGRVIDSNGKPVRGAHVLLHPPVPPGDLVIFDETDAEGRFRHEGVTDVPVREEILYATTPFPPNTYISESFTPPFDDELKDICRSFSGRQVLINKDQEVDVGNIPVQLQYVVLIVRCASAYQLGKLARCMAAYKRY